VMAILADATPDMEQISVDEAFLDCTGDPESGDRLAARLKRRIGEETQLPCSIGIATNKLVAKIATERCKPDGLLAVPPGQEAAFLAPLAVRDLWGVGPKTQARLEALGIVTIGDLAAYPIAELVHLYGQNGYDLADRARGIDESPVESRGEAKSVSQETTFTKDVSDAATLRRAMREQADCVAASLRADGLSALTVRIKVRWPPFITITRQTSLPQPTALSEEIFRAAWTLLEREWHPGKPVRLIGVGTSHFNEDIQQLELFPDPAQRNTRKLEETVDAIRERYGKKSVQRASSIKK
jgi:DNA polymerase IV